MAEQKTDDKPEAKQERQADPDPVIVAALIDDPDDDEEEKARRAELLGADSDDDEEEDEDDDSASTGKDKPKKSSDEDDDKGKSDDEDEQDDDKPDAKKSKPDDDSKNDSDDQDKLSRKERREQRKQSFLDEISSKQPDSKGRDQLFNVQPYTPLDYDKQDEFKTDELLQDRNAFGDYRFAQGAKIERYYAQQERFWDNVSHDNELLLTDPKYKFLDEKSSDFDEDKAGDVNELYLQIVGYQERPVTDASNQPVVDPATGQPKVVATVRRTDIPYGRFVEAYVKRMNDWADEQVADNAKQIATQRSNQGIRPGGSARKSTSLGKLRPGMISKMSDDDFEKHEAEIDAQIADMLQ